MLNRQITKNDVGKGMLTLLAVNDQVQDRHIGYVEILYDPIFYIILISGIGVAVFADAKDPNLEFVASLRELMR